MAGGKGRRTREGMKVTTLYLPAELIEKAKARGINISEAVREYLKAVLEDEEQQTLEELEKRILELEKELYKLRAQREAILQRRKEKMIKENRERALREALTKLKALFELKNKRAGSREETEIAREINRVKSEITVLTGLTEGSDEWTALMRALNTQGVDKAVEVALKWST